MRKKCSKCSKTRLLKSFAKDRRRKDGLTAWCFDCRSAYQKAYYAKPENKDRRKKYAAGYYQENRDEIRRKNDAYRRAHLAEYAAWSRKYRREHPEYAERHRALMRKRYREEREAG